MIPKEEANEPKKIDWKRKGLGWVPDYPDLRDYQLSSREIQEAGRLRREELTGSIESIAESVLEVFKILKVIKCLDEVTSSLNQLEEKITRRVFGGINFKVVRVHKILRKGDKNSEEILKLKKYLSILGYRGFLKSSELEDKEFKDFAGISNSTSHINWLASWINDPAFDEDTEKLVRAFQCYYSSIPDGTKISIDGVVGLEFYIALNQIFPTESQVEMKASTPIQLKPIESRVVSTPSLIPEPVFKVIFEQLKSRALEHIRLESNRSEIDSKTNIPEQEAFKLKQEAFQELFHDEQDGTNIENVLNQYLDPIQPVGDRLISFGEIFYNEFVVIDPIVSLCISIIYPLAEYKRFEDAVSIGLEILDFLLLDKEMNAWRRDFLLEKIGGLENRDKFKCLAILALKKVEKTFCKEGINLVLERRRKLPECRAKLNEDRCKIIEEYNAVLCFYFLLEGFLNRFKSSLSCGTSNNFYENESKKFYKQELFEITSSTEDKELLVENSLNLFPPSELAIPVSNSFYDSKHLQNQRNTSERLYFFTPSVVDLSFWCSAIEDQGSTNLCTSLAGIALIEYFVNRSRGKYTDASPLFLYKAARNLMGITGDVGASLRETMKAMALFGIPPEKYWPYQENLIDEEPPAFCYSFAQNYQAIKYFRLDFAGISRSLLLSQIKAVLAAGFPCMFGFTIYSSAYEDLNANKGWIPLPSKLDKVLGGHAVVAVGYSDYESVGRADGEEPSQGAILIRNSWGSEWGRGGYGWLPYDYILEGLTADWWSLLKAEWFEEDSFGWGARNTGGGNPCPTCVK